MDTQPLWRWKSMEFSMRIGRILSNFSRGTSLDHPAHNLIFSHSRAACNRSSPKADKWPILYARPKNAIPNPQISVHLPDRNTFGYALHRVLFLISIGRSIYLPSLSPPHCTPPPGRTEAFKNIEMRRFHAAELRAISVDGNPCMCSPSKEYP